MKLPVLKRPSGDTLRVLGRAPELFLTSSSLSLSSRCPSQASSRASRGEISLCAGFAFRNSQFQIRNTKRPMLKLKIERSLTTDLNYLLTLTVTRRPLDCSQDDSFEMIFRDESNLLLSFLDKLINLKLSRQTRPASGSPSVFERPVI